MIQVVMVRQKGGGEGTEEKAFQMVGPVWAKGTESHKPTYCVQITKPDAAWEAETSKEFCWPYRSLRKTLGLRRNAKDGGWHNADAQNIIVQ